MTSILANGQAAGTVGMIVWLVVLFAVMYFLMIRPQKKEQKKRSLCSKRLQQETQFLQQVDFTVQLSISRTIL